MVRSIHSGDFLFLLLRVNSTEYREYVYLTTREDRKKRRNSRVGRFKRYVGSVSDWDGELHVNQSMHSPSFIHSFIHSFMELLSSSGGILT